ncbi:unnamed protein product [Prorocentrum cordatum]|uniref:Uncharacterized protein n=1 Tax=Prorocentrum cordatum TaxID=2364126 RepID=A0ABN9XEP4_9DINO|nr:unnamed protein product [Polarella glacialis]
MIIFMSVAQYAFGASAGDLVESMIEHELPNDGKLSKGDVGVLSKGDVGVVKGVSTSDPNRFLCEFKNSLFDTLPSQVKQTNFRVGDLVESKVEHELPNGGKLSKGDVGVVKGMSTSDPNRFLCEFKNSLFDMLPSQVKQTNFRVGDLVESKVEHELPNGGKLSKGDFGVVKGMSTSDPNRFLCEFKNSLFDMLPSQVKQISSWRFGREHDLELSSGSGTSVVVMGIACAWLVGTSEVSGMSIRFSGGASRL